MTNREPPFSNLDPSVRPQLGRTLQWAVVDRVAGRRRKSPPTAHVPTQTPSSALLAADHSAIWLGHATALLRLGGLQVLTDPVFSDRLGPGVRRNVPPPLAAAALPPIDLVAISHNHRDHLDKPSVLAVERLHRPRYVVPLRVEDHLIAWGIPADRITSLGWWDEGAPLPDTPDLRVTCVPAQHWSQRGALDRNRSLWCGFVFRLDARTVYFAGDSGYFEGFKEIGQRFGRLDLGLIPIGAYDPQWFMSPQHMNPEEAGQAMLDVNVQRMISIHWGTFKLTDEPLDEPPLRLAAWRDQHRIPEDQALALPIGGGVAL